MLQQNDSQRMSLTLFSSAPARLRLSYARPLIYLSDVTWCFLYSAKFARKERQMYREIFRKDS